MWVGYFVIRIIMGDDMTLEELKSLKKELTRHDYKYYILFQPTISDYKYDMMHLHFLEGVTEIVGLDTRSLESSHLYPEWVRDEFKNVEPLT